MVIDAEALVIRKRLEQSLKELPPLPTAVAKVLDETNRQEPDMHRIDQIISGDQALASKVLRIVNSAYYGLSRQVTSVGQAVLILGIQQVRTITLSVGSIAAFSSKGPVDADGMRRFWQHSFATAAACTALCSKLNVDRKQADEIATIGILHDVGRMFFYCNFKQTYQKLVLRACQNCNSYEEEEFLFLGDTHAGVGAIVADKWELPEKIVEGIRLHEGPFDSGEISITVAILAVADWMNKSFYYDNKGPIGPLAPQLIETLGLTSEIVHEIGEEVRKKVDEASQIYGMMAA
ncbi:MAG: HDOD domain-containing protein [Armatimonadetes bacterium]|nr:HDOD domain-containing protein [Armatimonadota bacterium]MBS1700363.1 HDOD domain-containing protein [Armatimonadota bacterium]